MSDQQQTPPPRKYFHRKHGAYYFVRAGKWERLSDDLETALQLYASRMAHADCAIGKLLDDAIAARTGLRPSTRKQYRTAASHIRHAFQQFRRLDQIQPRHIAEFRRTMSGTPNMGNRCLSVLRMALDYALEMQWIDSNPAAGVRRHKERHRSRLLSATEYRAIYCQAGPRLQVIMDLCYLTGQRISDVLAIRRSQIRDGGIEFQQSKTGAKLLVRAPGLPDVIERALTLHGAVRALTLFRGRFGGPPKYRSVRDQWEAACTAAGVEDAHLHDLRALALTEADRAGLDAQALAGHTSEAMTRRYLRSKEIPEVNGPALSTIRSRSDRQ